MIKNDDKLTLREYCKVLNHFYVEANEIIINAGYSKISVNIFY